MSEPLVIYHPADTSKIFENKNVKPDHLWYLIHYNQHDKDEIDRPQFGKRKSARKSLNSIIEAGENADQRRFRALQSMEAQYLVKVFKLSGDSLIVHGIGASHVTENSLTIHPVYGIPFVPASSVKGIVRRWFIDAVLEGEAENLKAMDDNKAVIGRALFGTNESEGIIQFYDILMYEGLEITVDILNPHFSKYYSSKQEPDDTLFPIPNTFYAVKISSANLALTVDKGKLAAWLPVINLNEVEVMTLISRWVALAFQELGVGGKTSSGYGQFSNIEEVYDAFTQQQIKMEEDEKKKIEEMVAAMSPEELLIYQIEQLTSSSEDIERSKAIYKTVIERQYAPAAHKLKQYWIQNNEWSKSPKKSSKKQYNKCVLLNELSQKNEE